MLHEIKKLVDETFVSQAYLQIELNVTHSRQYLPTEASENREVRRMMLPASLTFCKIHERPLSRTKVDQR